MVISGILPQKGEGSRWCYYRLQGCSVGDRSSGLWGHVGPSPGVFLGGNQTRCFSRVSGFYTKRTHTQQKEARRWRNKKETYIFNLSVFWQNCTYWGSWVAGFGKKLCLDRCQVQSRVVTCQLTWCFQVLSIDRLKYVCICAENNTFATLLTTVWPDIKNRKPVEFGLDSVSTLSDRKMRPRLHSRVNSLLCADPSAITTL